jgi:hypothetical protein
LRKNVKKIISNVKKKMVDFGIKGSFRRVGAGQESVCVCVCVNKGMKNTERERKRERGR